MHASCSVNWITAHDVQVAFTLFSLKTLCNLAVNLCIPCRSASTILGTVAQGPFLERRSGSGSLGVIGGGGLATAPSGGLSSHLSGSPIREPGGFAARVARVGSPNSGRPPFSGAGGGGLSLSRAASAGLPPLGNSPSPGLVR